MLVSAASLALLLLAPAQATNVERDSTYVCAPTAGEPAYISRVAPEGSTMVVRGTGFTSKKYLLLIDDVVMNGPTIGDEQIAFPLASYQGKKILPAHVEIVLKSTDGSAFLSNTCTVEYPGLVPLWIGGASGLAFAGHGEGEPAAMVVGFLGMKGAAQTVAPTKRLSKKQGKWVEMGWGARTIRRSFVVGGITKAGSLGWGPTAGLGFRLGELRVLYALRWKKHEYPRHLFGIAGAFNVHSLIRQVQGGTATSGGTP